MRGLLVALFLFLSAADGSGEVLLPEIKKRAESAYLQQDYDTAFSVLADIPGLLGVIPRLDQPRGSARAEIFFDLARIRLAQNDTAQARSILAYVFALDQDIKSGVLDLRQDAALEETHQRLAQLRKQKRQQELANTTALGAAGRSLILPGWGHLYRGHRKRAYVFMGATAAAALYWFVADQSYKNAYNAYRTTQIGELDILQRNGDATDPFPFQQRFEKAQSKAHQANMALGILVGVWLAGALDHVIIGPAHLGVGVPIF